MTDTKEPIRYKDLSKGLKILVVGAVIRIVYTICLFIAGFVLGFMGVI